MFLCRCVASSANKMDDNETNSVDYIINIDCADFSRKFAEGKILSDIKNLSLEYSVK